MQVTFTKVEKFFSRVGKQINYNMLKTFRYEIEILSHHRHKLYINYILTTSFHPFFLASFPLGICIRRVSL